MNTEQQTPHVVEKRFDSVPYPELDDNLAVPDYEERPAEIKEGKEQEQTVLEEDVTVTEDGGHFNKNKDNQLSFSVSDEMQKVPQPTLESPLDIGLGVEVEQSPSGGYYIYYIYIYIYIPQLIQHFCNYGHLLYCFLGMLCLPRNMSCLPVFLPSPHLESHQNV